MSTMVGCTQYRGYSVQQHDNYQIVFNKFLKDENFDSILEIGTAGGGFTLFMRDTLPQAKILSYDIYDVRWYNEIRQQNVDIRVKNIFDDNIKNTLIPANVIDEEALTFINNSKKLLILCDGGNKIGEFMSLSRYTKPGDFIMAHDYSQSLEYFNTHINKKIWDWCEITEDYIKKSCDENNLVDYHRDEFQDIVWVCKQRI